MSLAGGTIYGRGKLLLGTVRLDIADGKAKGTAQGTGKYRLQLDFSGAKLAGRCSCPYSDNTFFCKHLVAASLLVVRRSAQPDLPPAAPQPPSVMPPVQLPAARPLGGTRSLLVPRTQLGLLELRAAQLKKAAEYERRQNSAARPPQ